jgi:hypothetical protein
MKYTQFIRKHFQTTYVFAKRLRITWPTARKYEAYPLMTPLTEIAKMSKLTGVPAQDIVQMIFEADKVAVKSVESILHD